MQNRLIFSSFQLTGPLMSLFGPDGIFLYFASVSIFYVFSFWIIIFYVSSFWITIFYVFSFWIIIFSRSLPSTPSSWWSWFQRPTEKPSLTSTPERALKNFSLSREFEKGLKKEKTFFQYEYLGCAIFVIKHHRPTQSILWLKDNQVCLHQNIYKLIKNNCMPKTVTL